MSAVTPFQLDSTTIDAGVTLLEASAGTGKTYTIAGIVVRLIAVDDLTIRDILVVTFTEAATRELRDRIRKRLVTVDEDLARDTRGDLVSQAILNSGVDVTLARRRIELALASFDEATISTIHGFCQRVLRDHAFEGDAPFDAEIIPEAGTLLLDLAYDFWRRAERRSSPLIAALAHRETLTPEGLAALAGRLSRQPQLIVLPRSRSAIDEASTAVQSMAEEIRLAWATRRSELVSLLETHRSISRSKTSGMNASHFRILRTALDHHADHGTVTTATLDAIERLSAESIEQRRLKTPAARKDPFPHHEFFSLCSRFIAAKTEWVTALRAAWLAFASLELPKLKAQRKVMTFDDLLNQTFKALKGANGRALVGAVRRQYRAALIDEFQDTDPVQYEIFRSCFAAAPHRLMLIGDPKQSIYGFRGADLFTYLEARKDAEAASPPRIHTLGTNYRSSSAMVDAINDVFSLTRDCFLQDGIVFERAMPDGSRAAQAPLSRIDDRPFPPFVLVDAGTHHEISSTKTLGVLLAHDIANEIREVLRSMRLGERPVTAADIAILVRFHNEAAVIEEVLREHGIPAVRHTDASVFQSQEAEELIRTLRAVTEPGNDRMVRAALATSLLGQNASDLFALESDSERWSRWLDRFARLRELWLKHGFSRMFRHLLATQQIRRRLLGQTGGERKLTNLLQLGELAQHAEREHRFPPTGLIEWMIEQGRESTSTADEHVQRLEKDDDAVKIVTIHNSKGLEYPIVFCPSHWGEKRARETLFHDPRQNAALTLDLTEPKIDEHQRLAEREALAEEIRLFYVSLTRAIHRCYLYVHRRKSPMKSALGCVLGEDYDDACRRLVETAPSRFELRGLHEERGNPVLAEVRGEAALTAADIVRRASAESMIGSFSRLVAGAEDENAQDHDDFSVVAGTSTGSLDDESPMSRLPRGSATGIALHAVLELADFRRPDLLGPLVRHHFGPLGVDGSLQDALTQHLAAMMRHPLDTGRETLRLESIGADDRLNEVEFFYPITPFDAGKLASACESPKSLDRLQFSPVNGYLRGFMDLVFRFEGRYYLLDWKSNWLGPRSEDYSRKRLDAVMARSFYSLQSWLYALALDRYLAQRLTSYRYERDFGGIFYLFVRGLDVNQPENGVHFSKPPAAFIRRLASALLREGTGR